MSVDQRAMDGVQPETDYPAYLRALTQPGALPVALAAGEVVEVVQTHASAVLLAGNRAYKLKKPNDFGFFDYSTPALRRHFCGEEVRLNARLAPSVYLGVAPVQALADGALRFGATLAPEALPEPGAEMGGGVVIDYAVVMVRLPEDATLAAQVRDGRATAALLAAVAERMAAFHAACATDAHIASFGGLGVVGGNWDENFEQMRPYIGRALDQATFDSIEGYVRGFIEQRQALFAARMRDGRIRDCHGDLRLQHVYQLPAAVDGAEGAETLAIVDCIEFNERFRYGDVAGEIAFLVMELDMAGRADLAKAFVDAYVLAAGDEALRELLPFYACYRACVRGKVLAFQLDQTEVPAEQRERARDEAGQLFALAGRYASGPTAPTLLLIGGLMGSGKSTLGEELRRSLGWELIASDATRKRLANLDAATPQEAAFGTGIYAHEWTARTYEAMRVAAAAALAEGRSALLDASFVRRADRLSLAGVARDYGARAVFVECVCPRKVTLERLARRWQERVTPEAQGTEREMAASGASDGRPELYDAQAALWEPVTTEEAAAGLAHAQVDTARWLEESVEGALDALGVARFACWVA
ncbi:MAG: hypothetical protein OJF49_002928 [Ktedonobacterales bacterium]|jgi:aminoglycoside phosphotransferase family enzyme/predicted kinase|nr:MAG: hypothetical protein OJF49_002928 [Ktedonobacterales bacterium]